MDFYAKHFELCKFFGYIDLMDASEIRSLLVGGETETVEFKEEVNDTELIEAVVCLANGSGGRLLVGVDDRGRVVGLKPRHGDRTDPSRIEALILGRTRPSVQASAEVASTDDGDVLVVEVPVASTVVATSGGKFLRRSIDAKGEPQCLPMEPHEVLARVTSLGAQDFSRFPLKDSGFDDLSDDLSFVEMARFRELAGESGDRVLANLSDSDLLGALDLLDPSGALTVGALLLFGREEAIRRRLPAYEAGFQELAGYEVRTNEIGPVPLLRAMVEMSDRVKARNPEEEIEVGLLRVPLPRYADAAVRELIANALVHRDYTAQGVALVEISNAGLTVSNPGGFPEGIGASNLLAAPPRPRNPALADAFKRAGLVERTGRGVNRAFMSQLQLGRPAPDYSLSNTNSVVVRLRPGPADKDMAAFIAEARRGGREFSLEDLLVLHEVRRERLITVGRAAVLFQSGEQDARAVLNDLADRGLVEARGRTSGRAYHLAASLYRRLGEPAQYVRAGGFDAIQQEQMVSTFVERHGSITRREAADLCQITSEQASRLLRRMRDDGKLTLIGEKRAARYVKPDTASS